MLERFLVWERDAFFLLNGSDSAFLDHFMWLYSGKVVWLPLAVFIIAVLCYRKSWRIWLPIFLAIALTITLCDQFASHLCKPLFTRFRPTHHPDFMDQVKVVFDYRGGLYGFISSHAANAFGFATLMSLILRDKLLGWTLFFWATLTAYSRVYLGVHFISDIIPGALSGCLFGYLVYLLYLRATRAFFPLPAGDTVPALYSRRRTRLIACSIWLTILLLILLEDFLISCLH